MSSIAMIASWQSSSHICLFPFMNRYTTKYFHVKDDTHPCEEFLDDRDLKMFNVVRHLTHLTDDQLVALANIARGYVIENHVKEEKGADHKVLGIGK